MTEHDIEEKVKSAFTSCVPNVLDNVLSECDRQRGRVITMTEASRKIGIFKWAAGIAAALVLVFAGVLGIRLYQTNFNVASTVSLDVNPSIEIKTNQKEIVLEVNALNDDGKTVIGEMDLKGSRIDVVVNALIGSMLRSGFLNDASNSILVSVCGENGESSLALQEKLTREINEMLKTDTFSGAVLSQTITPDSELQELADSYGISLGKARLIRQVIAQQPEYSLEELSGLTINELNLISEVNGIALDEVQSVGSASDKAYIGVDKAKEAAFSRVGVSSESDVSKLEVEMDYEHGIMIYEVSFLYNGYKYNFDIDACSGAITEEKSNPVEDKGKEEKLPDDNSQVISSTGISSGSSSTDSSSSTSSSSGNSSTGSSGSSDNGNSSTSVSASSISSDRAKEIAFSNAGVSSEGEVTKLEIETDNEHGVIIYEVSFFYDGCKYNYDIDANTGAIMESKISPVEDKGNSESSTVSPNIGADRAKEIAFSHAGVTAESGVSKLEIETDKEHGVTIYEVSFSYNNYKYEYDIDAETGEIIKVESSPAENKTSSDNKNQKPSKSDKSNDKNPDPESEGFIVESAAKEAALLRAGLSAGDIAEYSCETYVQKETSVYKIKFISGEYEYSCDVNANSGEIVKYDKQLIHSR